MQVQRSLADQRTALLFELVDNDGQIALTGDLTLGGVIQLPGLHTKCALGHQAPRLTVGNARYLKAGIALAADQAGLAVVQFHTCYLQGRIGKDRAALVLENIACQMQVALTGNHPLAAIVQLARLNAQRSLADQVALAAVVEQASDLDAHWPLADQAALVAVVQTGRLDVEPLTSGQDAALVFRLLPDLDAQPSFRKQCARRIVQGSQAEVCVPMAGYLTSAIVQVFDPGA
ncbi:hypothetical protein D3C77_354330 [compost metagenome]